MGEERGLFDYIYSKTRNLNRDWFMTSLTD